MKSEISKSYNSKGFTLVELLIVIVIIGILAGIVLSVINPAKQQQRANESVLRANTEKACLALAACGVSTTTLGNCDTFVEIGIDTPAAPTGATYAPDLTVANTVKVVGTLGTCEYECAYNFATQTSTALDQAATSVCLID